MVDRTPDSHRLPMFRVETVSAREKYRDQCEDYSQVFAQDQRTVIAVADGAGGMGFGDVAAKSLVLRTRGGFEEIHSANQWKAFLESADSANTAGETTAVIVDIRPMGIAGASVGDSQAWGVCNGVVTDLTSKQERKPLIGSREAVAVPFMHRQPLEGVLIVASDGLFDYAKRDEIVKLISQSDFHSIPRKCIELVRLPSGELWDDIVVVAARVAPPKQSRQRYDID